MTDKELSPEELERQAADPLPVREEMSLISTNPTTGLIPPTEGFSAQEAGTTAGGAGAGGTQAAGEAGEVAAADGSSTEGGGLTSEDRSESFSSQDSATATS